MMHLNNLNTAEATGIYPQEMTLSTAKKSNVLTDKEYIGLLKDTLKEITERFDANEHQDSLNQFDVFEGKPRNFTVPKHRGVVAEFYVKKIGSIEEIERSITALKGDPFATMKMDIDEALVYVRVIKEGNLLYPDVHYAQAQQDTGRHIAYHFIQEVPYFGDLQELDRAKEQRIVKQKFVKASIGVGGIAATAAVFMSLISAHGNNQAAEVNNELHNLSSYSLSLDNVHHAAKILQDGSTVSMRKEALSIISHWADSAVMKPHYLGRTDDTYSGPIFFSRIADKALETENDPTLRASLSSFKNHIMIKGTPVILNEFNYYADIAKSPSGMSPAQAKAMAWEHVLIPTQQLTEGIGTRPEQLKMANNLGAIIYSSSKAIPALRFDYQRSITPQFPRISDPLVRTTVEQWAQKE